MSILSIIIKTMSIGSTRTSTIVVFHKSPISVKICDKSLILNIIKSQVHYKLSGDNGIKEKFIATVSRNFSILNDQYERFVGVTELRQIHDKVLSVEKEFIEVTKKRKFCQDQIDKLKDDVKALREKLDTLPRSSDSYLNLLTTEHRLLKDLITWEGQLSQLKDKEQCALDSFSTLLRQSHESEKIRQEKAKHLSVISIILSAICYTIALIKQKAQSQKTLIATINANQEKLSSVLEETAQSQDKLTSVLQQLNNVKKVVERLDKTTKSISEIIGKKPKIDTVTISAKSYSWTSYVPGLTTLVSWFKFG